MMGFKSYFDYLDDLYQNTEDGKDATPHVRRAWLPDVVLRPDQRRSDGGGLRLG